jgi:hypothetical protein
MAKKPITPGQKAAKARDRERFAAKLAGNEAEADRVHERLVAGDPLTQRRGGDETFAFPDGDHVAPAVVAILLYRKTARMEGNALVPCTPDASARLPRMPGD